MCQALTSIWQQRCGSTVGRIHSVHAPSQWETTLHCNVVSHWLGSYTKWSLSGLANDLKSLSELLLTNHLWSLVAFSWGKFHRKSSRYKLSLILDFKCISLGPKIETSLYFHLWPLINTCICDSIWKKVHWSRDHFVFAPNHWETKLRLPLAGHRYKTIPVEEVPPYFCNHLFITFPACCWERCIAQKGTTAETTEHGTPAGSEWPPRQTKNGSYEERFCNNSQVSFW